MRKASQGSVARDVVFLRPAASVYLPRRALQPSLTHSRKRTHFTVILTMNSVSAENKRNKKEN